MANNDIRKVFTRIEDSFWQTKSQRQDTTNLKFLFIFDQLNFIFLKSIKKEKIIEIWELIFIESEKIFENRKNNDKYWNKAK